MGGLGKRRRKRVARIQFFRGDPQHSFAESITEFAACASVRGLGSPLLPVMTTSNGWRAVKQRGKPVTGGVNSEPRRDARERFERGLRMLAVARLPGVTEQAVEHDGRDTNSRLA